MARSIAHLPGLEQASGAVHVGETAAGKPFEAPGLSGQDARVVATAVRDAALRARRERDLGAVLGAASRAALRLADDTDPLGREATSLLVAELGWSDDLARRTLVGMAACWTEAALRSVVDEELGGPGVLEGFVPSTPPPGTRPESGAADGGGQRARRRRALGPPLLHVVHAGNVPGVAVTAALRGLVVRSGVLSKTAEGEPGLLALFARAVDEEDALLGRCLATTWWPGGEAPPAESVWVKQSRKVIVYGGDEAVAGVRRRAGAHADVVAYGPRIGAAVLLPDADLAAAAGAIAGDVCAYEQGGCVSPRIVYAVGRPAAAAAAPIAAALAEETARRPPPAPGAAEATAIRSLRAEAEFAGYGDAGEPGNAEPSRLFASEEDLAWTVVAGGDPTPRSEALPRVVRVHGVADLAHLQEVLAPLEGRIQALGYAGSAGDGELAERAAELGVSRVAPVGTMAWPPADWRHDGRHQLLPLVTWTDWED